MWVTDLCALPQVVSLVDIKGKTPFVTRGGSPAEVNGWLVTSFQGDIHCFDQFPKTLRLVDQDHGCIGFPTSAPLVN